MKAEGLPVAWLQRASTDLGTEKGHLKDKAAKGYVGRLRISSFSVNRNNRNLSRTPDLPFFNSLSSFPALDGHPAPGCLGLNMEESSALVFQEGGVDRWIVTGAASLPQ